MGTGVLRLLGREVRNRCVRSGPDSYSVIGETNTQPPGCKASAYRVCHPDFPPKLATNSVFNPLTTEFFPPRQHIFMHSAHTTFVGTPLPQHSLLSGQTWWGPHTWRDPSGNTVNDIHDPPQAQQSEVKGGCQPDFRPAFP